MDDRSFDWQSRHDDRSLAFPIRAAIGDQVKRRKRMWRGHRRRLDQGREGACVGFGWTAELQARPNVVGGYGGTIQGYDAQQFARMVYREAQKIDQWAGEAYEGTSVLAGAKVCRMFGFVPEFRWAFSIDDVIDAIVANGPVVVGIPWYDGMYSTRPSGLVDVSGSLVGGHCLTLTGYHPKIRLTAEGWRKRFEVVKWRNSWGRGYGFRGDGYVKVEDLEQLLSGRNRGEACVPMERVTRT